MQIEDVEVCQSPKSYADAVKQKSPPKPRKKSARAEINNVQLKSVKADNSIKPLETIQVLLAVLSANINVMPKSLAKQFFKSTRLPAIIQESKCTNNTGMKILGRILTDLVYKDVLFTDVEWQVSPASRLIIGRQLLKQLRLISKNFPYVSRTEADKPLTKEEARRIPENQPEVSLPDEPQQKIDMKHVPELNNIAKKFPDVF